MTAFEEPIKDVSIVTVMLDWLDNDPQALRSLIDYVLSLDSIYSGDAGASAAGRTMFLIKHRREFYEFLCQKVVQDLP